MCCENPSLTVYLSAYRIKKLLTWGRPRVIDKLSARNNWKGRASQLWVNGNRAVELCVFGMLDSSERPSNTHSS
ncbi:hypothetical protein Y032_0001g185 [Ancylostoma ceylanicum]|nr:hypothetical protein Y032_0001g185 [Ancylostoma ceylanicum]